MHNYTVNTISQNNLKTCSVVGARGYSGLEVVRLLLNHPKASLTHCFATQDFSITDYLANSKAKRLKCLPEIEIMQNLTDFVFLATPAEVSLKLAPEILAQNKKVIDLSGAYRLKKHEYKKWYGFEHGQYDLLKDAHYGLTSWSSPSKNESLVANPGCYATATSLALLPLLKLNLIDEKSIVVDAKSGSSGAGRKATENLLFTEVEGECLPYKVGKHQHLPEILETVEAFSGKTIEMHFSTSLLPIRRGIIAGVYCNLKDTKSISDVAEAFQKFYGDNPLFEIRPLSQDSSLLSLKKVVGTAKTHISYEVVGKKLFVYSCIDNLLKGAASQAIENFNRLCDLPLSTGLSHLEALT